MYITDSFVCRLSSTVCFSPVLFLLYIMILINQIFSWKQVSTKMYLERREIKIFNQFLLNLLH